MTKMDKRELKKPDEFVSWGTRAAQYAADNALVVIGGALLVLVLVASTYAWMHNRGAREVEAAKSLYAGEKLMEPDMGGAMGALSGMNLGAFGKAKPEDLEKAIGEFKAVAEQYPGTKASRRAWAQAGDAYMELQQWDEAAKAYERALGGSGVERYYALNGIAHAYESKQAADEAAAAYRKIVDDAQASFRDHAALDLARVLENQGKTDEAKDLLGQFPTRYPNSPLKSDAEARFRRLGGTPAATASAAPEAPVPGHEGHDHGDGGAH